MGSLDAQVPQQFQSILRLIFDAEWSGVVLATSKAAPVVPDEPVWRKGRSLTKWQIPVRQDAAVDEKDGFPLSLNLVVEPICPLHDPSHFQRPAGLVADCHFR
jgi:hypothetical protein